MKKEYIKPVVKVSNIDSSEMLCSSTLGIKSEEEKYGAYAKEFDWDDEEEW